MSTPFDHVRLGEWDLPQRFVMAPLTRDRAGDDGVPSDLAVEYYRQRATAGLIVAEGTQPNAVGQSYLRQPGLHTPEQIAGWARVADAVHAEGGRIVVQLMHGGRISHPDNKHGAETVAPSAIQAPGVIVTPTGKQEHPTPRALELDELPGVVADFVAAARGAIEAGLDGVEIHSANGYLLHEFLAPSANHRTDAYGGSPQARARLTIEVTRAVAEAIGAQRVGVRISPMHNVQGAVEDDPADAAATYAAVVDGIKDLGLAYLSVLADQTDPVKAELTADLRARFGGPVMLNCGFTRITTFEEVTDLLARDLADVVAVGRPFIANPDLARRWREGAELNTPDPSTFYTEGARGYTDYPSL